MQNSAIINSVNQNYQTPLMVASAYNQVEVIKYLLKKGAKIDKKDKESFTPLLVMSTAIQFVVNKRRTVFFFPN